MVSSAVKSFVDEVIECESMGTVFVGVDDNGHVGVWTDDDDSVPRYESDIPASEKDAVVTMLSEVPGFSVITDDDEWRDQLDEWNDLGGGNQLGF